jgi:pantetheine-phosphate adenylyltransferase
MTKKLAIFPGSFDPLTNGHVSIIERALAIFDEVIVAVTINVSKTPFLETDERMRLIRACFPSDDRVIIEQLDGLLAHYARERGACAIVRGLRAPSDFEYELQMSHMNRHLNRELETVFFSAEAEGSYVSSSLVREVASLGGDVTDLVPGPVAQTLRERFS